MPEQSYSNYFILQRCCKNIEVNIVSIFQVPSSNGLGVMELKRFGGKG
jgi:hypothetical protein